MTIEYLSTSGVAKHLNLSPETVSSYYKKGLLPTPDATIGITKGWLPETIDKWNENRPGQGNHTRGENRRGGR